jgi:hypothetical protein
MMPSEIVSKRAMISQKNSLMYDDDDDACSGTCAESVDEVKAVESFASKETKDVRMWRLIVVAVVLIAGSAVCAGTYIFLGNELNQDSYDAVSYVRAGGHPHTQPTMDLIRFVLFGMQFEMFANTIEGVCQTHFTNMFEASRSMARAMTADAILRNLSFPNATFPMFEVYATEARKRAGWEVISYAPVVTGEQLDGFNAYTVENQDWVNVTREVALKVDKTLIGTPYQPAPQPNQTFDFFRADSSTSVSSGPGPFTPLWHVSPPPLTSFFFKTNFYSIPEYGTMAEALEIVKGAFRLRLARKDMSCTPLK